MRCEAKELIFFGWPMLLFCPELGIMLAWQWRVIGVKMLAWQWCDHTYYTSLSCQHSQFQAQFMGKMKLDEPGRRKPLRQNSWPALGEACQSCITWISPCSKEGTFESSGFCSEGVLNFCVRGTPPRNPSQKVKTAWSVLQQNEDKSARVKCLYGLRHSI